MNGNLTSKSPTILRHTHTPVTPVATPPKPWELGPCLSPFHLAIPSPSPADSRLRGFSRYYLILTSGSSNKTFRLERGGRGPFNQVSEDFDCVQRSALPPSSHELISCHTKRYEMHFDTCHFELGIH